MYGLKEHEKYPFFIQLSLLDQLNVSVLCLVGICIFLEGICSRPPSKFLFFKAQ